MAQAQHKAQQQLDERPGKVLVRCEQLFAFERLAQAQAHELVQV